MDVMSLFSLISEAPVSSPLKLQSPLTSKSKSGHESLMPTLRFYLKKSRLHSVDMYTKATFEFFIPNEFGAGYITVRARLFVNLLQKIRIIEIVSLYRIKLKIFREI